MRTCDLLDSAAQRLHPRCERRFIRGVGRPNLVLEPGEHNTRSSVGKIGGQALIILDLLQRIQQATIVLSHSPASIPYHEGSGRGRQSLTRPPHAL